MKILLLSVGKTNEAYIQPGVEEFTRRLTKYYTSDWQLIAPPRNAAALSDSELKKQEAKLILQQVQSDDFLVLMDERGKQLSSTELADFVVQRSNESRKRLVFLIGGAYGVDDTVFKRANYTWSLSKLVFPHMLVRLVLVEQLYRACTIIKNEKYHHK